MQLRGFLGAAFTALPDLTFTLRDRDGALLPQSATFWFGAPSNHRWGYRTNARVRGLLDSAPDGSTLIASMGLRRRAQGFTLEPATMRLLAARHIDLRARSTGRELRERAARIIYGAPPDDGSRPILASITPRTEEPSEMMRTWLESRGYQTVNQWVWVPRRRGAVRIRDEVSLAQYLDGLYADIPDVTGTERGDLQISVYISLIAEKVRSCTLSFAGMRAHEDVDFELHIDVL